MTTLEKAWEQGYNARCDDEDGDPEVQTDNPYRRGQPQVQLYMWRSAYLAQYRRGYIIIPAGSVEEAREIAAAALEAEVDDRIENLRVDPEDREDHITMALTNIEYEPAVLDRLLIEGSE